MIKTLLLIGSGGFAGSVLRYLATRWVQAGAAGGFPWGTLAVNLAGCFAIGLLFGAAERGGIGEGWRFFLMTGLLGGFTTFSAFSAETFAMLRSGELAFAGIYVAASVVAGLAATWLGVTLIK